jgi:hypothetical protein
MSNSSHVYRYLKISLILVAVFLLLVNVAGLFLHPSYETTRSIRKKGTPGYHYAVSDKTGLLQMLKQKGDTNNPSYIDSTTSRVFYSMFHTENRRIAFYENWPMWLAGKLYKPAGRTQDAALLVKGGAGNCSERTQVLKDIFELNGLPGKVISLNGHIALQVLFNGAWKVADADHGLVFNGDMDQMESDEGLRSADSILAKNGFDPVHRAKYLHYWKTENDNRLSPLNKVSNPRLFNLEKFSQWLKWILPALVLLFYLIPWDRKKKTYG